MDGTIRKVRCKQMHLREAIESVRAHVCIAIVFSASMDESRQVPDEKVVELHSLLEIISKFT